MIATDASLRPVSDLNAAAAGPTGDDGQPNGQVAGGNGHRGN